MESYADADVIVVGAGHNGLVCAGYLAAAGRKVLVLEGNRSAGGGLITADLAEPGYRSERASLLHIRILPNPLITDDELGLQRRYGLEYLPMEVPYAAIFDDGYRLPIGRDRAATMARIDTIAARDAEAYDRFMNRAVALTELLTPTFFVPPSSPPSQSVPGPSSLERELLRASQMSVADVLAEWFDDEHVRIALSRMASELTLAHPEDLGTGTLAYLAPGLTERYGMALPRGGGSAFIDACVRCIEDHGGRVETGVRVTRVLTNSGRVVGVRTADGEELRASDAVLAAIHPHRLGDMVENIDPAIARLAAATKLSPYTAFVVHASLDHPLRFIPGSESDQTPWNTLSSSGLGNMNRAFDELRRGRLPTMPLLEAGCPSNVDPTRAPEGKAVLHMLCLTTRNLAEGGPERWHAIKDAYADQLLKRLGTFTTNLDPDVVRARALVTPLDHEQQSASFAGGDYTGLAGYSHQMGARRPIPELGQYTVPGLRGLYLTGPFMHPGGGVVGGGRATAIEMFKDLELDFDQFVSA